MAKLRVLIVDDSEDDAMLVVRELRKAGYDLAYSRVQDAAAVKEALRSREWDVIVCDYSMPSFTGLDALAIYNTSDLDIPFIVISGTVGEDVAVQTMKAGAHDYVMKDSLTRLGPAVQRELGDARTRADNRRAGEALREQGESLRTLINAMPDIVCFKDGEGRWLEANDFDLKLFGLEGVDYRGKKDSDLAVHSDFYREAFLACEDSDEIAWNAHGLSRGEEVIPRPDGPPKIFDIIKVPMFNEDGSRKGLVVVGRDVTERKKAEGERERLSMAIEQAAEAVIMTDAEGTIQYVNPAFETTTGYSRADAVGENPRLLKSDKQDTRFYEELWAAIAGGDVWSGRLINRKKNGDLYDQETVISPVRSDTGEIVNYVAVARDVSHEMALQNQLVQSQKMEAVGKLAGGVAHDFNNLLMVILNDALFVKAALDSSSPSHADLEEIIQTSNRGADLARRLLAFSRRQTLTPRVVDLSEVSRGVEKMLRRLIVEDIKVEFRLHALPLVVEVDVGQIEQVLVNLAVNARDAMRDGGKLTISTGRRCLDATIEGSLEKMSDLGSKEFAVIDVSDTGVGIPESARDRIFEPFFTTKEVGQGTGLGLSTVYGIVRQHNGYVHVDSKEGRGTTFSVYLPLTSLAPDTETAEVTEIPRGSETILLVEDNRAVRIVTRRMLEALGYHVLDAGGYDEALEHLKDEGLKLDLLLTDVVMPGVDGVELAKRIRTLRPDIRVILASGYPQEQLDRHGVLRSEAKLLKKPFNSRTLGEAIREVLDSE